MKQKELIRRTKEFATENRKLSWQLFLYTLAIQISLFSLIALFPNIFVQLLFAIMAGLVNIRLFVIYHDFLHGAIFRGNPIARFFFWFYGIYILSPVEIWKRSHNHHHAYNSKLSKPSIGSFNTVTVDKYNSLGKKKKLIYSLQRHPLTILLGHFTMFILNFNLLPLKNSFRRHIDSLVSISLYISISILLVMTSWQNYLLFYFLPLFMPHAIGTYIFYAQHNFPGAVFYSNNDWLYEKAALESSSYLKTDIFFRWITANIGYHHIHHLNPSIPFYNLPIAHEVIKEYVVPMETSFQLTDIRKCLKLKVYDDRKNKLVGWTDCLQHVL